jgi:hypothetical protein
VESGYREIGREERTLRAMRSWHDWVAGVVRAYVLPRKRKVLEEAMAAGYRAEAASPSLEAEWRAVEVEDHRLESELHSVHNDSARQPELHCLFAACGPWPPFLPPSGALPGSEPSATT